MAMATAKMVSGDNNQLPTKCLQLLLDQTIQNDASQLDIQPGRMRPQTGKRSLATTLTALSRVSQNQGITRDDKADKGSVVSSIIGNMYTPSTTARTRTRQASEYGASGRGGDGRETFRTQSTKYTAQSRGSACTTQSGGHMRASWCISCSRNRVP